MKNWDEVNAIALDANSPSTLEWWYEDEPKKLEIVRKNGFQLLLMMELEGLTLFDAAEKLIENMKENG